MNEHDKIEVEKMILEAKLDVSETRLKMFFTIAGALLGIFGILIPMILAINSSSQINKGIVRADKAIEKMEESFKELAGTQLRKPEIQCYFNGRELANTVLNIVQEEAQTLEIKNIGDAPATIIRLHLYILDDKGIDQNGITYSWQYSYFNDEPQYSKLFTFGDEQYLDPKESFPVELGVQTLRGKEWTTPAQLKIYYGQPDPKLIPFTINVAAK